MADKQDIYNAMNDTIIRNGTIVVNPGGIIAVSGTGTTTRWNTSYAGIAPTLASISGKYDTSFDAVVYYTQSG